jgi:hypothetical protein
MKSPPSPGGLARISRVSRMEKLWKIARKGEVFPLIAETVLAGSDKTTNETKNGTV